MITPSSLRPFGKLCVTLGMIPTSYKESMTYEEQLIWFCNYLENKVIPALNNNAEALQEVQALYEELRKFIVDYFAHLDLQDEIDNKLDEMASDGTLENIINQNLFNELNNKINNNISVTTNNSLLLTDTCKILFPYRGQNAGDCFIIQNANKNIIIDLGKNITELINYLLNNNITKIDYIIISHYHSDHIAGNNAEGFITLLDNQNFDFSNLVVYLPHKNIDWSRIQDENKLNLQTAENTIKNKITSKGYSYIEPNNNDILTLSEICNIKFLNVGSEFYNSYYGTYNEYNNFSLCCELSHINRTVLFTGDIYVEAQSNITPYIKEPDILKCPHHDLEPVASEVFMKKLSSQIMIFEENQNYYGSGITTPISQTIKNNGGKIYDTNFSRDIVILLKNDNILCNSQNGVFTLQTTQILNSSGIKIPLNTDLNLLTEQGNYYTLSNGETMSLKHLPYNKENIANNTRLDFGRAKIINIGIDITKNYIKQFFITPVYLFYRFYNEHVWSNWQNISSQNLFDVPDNFIENNTNLNNVFEIGKYEILNNDTLNTLINCPANNEGGSILLVLATRNFTDLRHQVLLTSSGNIYKRTLNMDLYNASVVSASDWKKVQFTNVS